MIPVVILTGFLGSGKTTLLNRWMARRAALAETRKVAVIVNELGEVGIDASLLPSGGARQVELPGGCICCALSGDLDRTIAELIAATDDLEVILIETTGVAEPIAIAWTLQREPLAERVRLASVVTLVDATRFLESLPLSPVVGQQVEDADVLVLTKAELVDQRRRAAVLTAVRELSEAPMREGSADEMAAWLGGVLEDPPMEREERERSEHEHQHGHEHEHEHGHEHGVHGIVSVSRLIEGTLDAELLEEGLAALPADYIRIKGIARVIDGRTGSTAEHYLAFHRVGLRVSMETLPEPSTPRVVALGPGISPGPLDACLAHAVISSPSAP